MTHPSILDNLLNNVDEAHHKGQKVLVVFDLDSTLFNVTGRTLRILQMLMEHPEMMKKYPEEMLLLSKVEFTPRDWGLRAPLTRAGLRASSIDFFHQLRDFWVQHFFSNSHLHADVPYQGAVEYVQELKKRGAKIMYLTGRDEPRMGDGTRASLQQWNFPLDDENCELLLKPVQGLDDAEFKRDVFLKLGEGYHSVWLFENEPVNIHLIAKECPHVQIVFFDSTHSGRATAPTEHPIIQNYLRSSKSTPK